MIARMLAQKKRQRSELEQDVSALTTNQMRPTETTASSSSTTASAVDITRPCTPRKNSWWLPAIRTASAPAWCATSSKVLTRRLRFDSLCSNICTEIGVCEQLGLPIDPIHCCDPNDKAAELALLNYGPAIGCFWQDMLAFSQKRGQCYVHGTACSRNDDAELAEASHTCERRDLLIVGSPCQPFSDQSSRKARKCNEHRLFETTFGSGRHGSSGRQRIGDSVVECVAATKPRAVLLEQIVNFERADDSLGAGVSPLQLFTADLMALELSPGVPLYSAFHVFDMDSDIFLDMARPRNA